MSLSANAYRLLQVVIPGESVLHKWVIKQPQTLILLYCVGRMLGGLSQFGSVTRSFCKPKTAVPEQQFKTNINALLAKGFQNLDRDENSNGN